MKERVDDDSIVLKVESNEGSLKCSIDIARVTRDTTIEI